MWIRIKLECENNFRATLTFTWNREKKCKQETSNWRQQFSDVTTSMVLVRLYDNKTECCLYKRIWMKSEWKSAGHICQAVFCNIKIETEWERERAFSVHLITFQICISQWEIHDMGSDYPSNCRFRFEWPLFTVIVDIDRWTQTLNTISLTYSFLKWFPISRFFLIGN